MSEQDQHHKPTRYKHLRLHLKESTHRILKATAAMKGITIQEAFELAIEEWVEKER